MAYLIDTSVLIDHQGRPGGVDEEAAISVATLMELHYGVLVAGDDAARARRLGVLSLVERNLEALPVDEAVAREWGRLYAAVAQRGGRPRRRALDLAIAATATVHGATLLTSNLKDFAIIDDLVTVRAPRAS